MSDADALLWTIGRDPVLRTTICSVMTLERAPDWEELRKRFATLVEDLPAFRSTVRLPPPGRRRPRWVTDPGFDLDLHLHRVTATAPGDLRVVLDLAQAMATVAFDPELAPWEAVVVDGLRGGGAALVVKLHHALVDGLGGIAVVARLVDGAPAVPAAAGAAPEELIPARPWSPARALTAATAMVAAGARAVGRIATRPADTISGARAAAASAARLLAPAPHPLSTLMTGRSLYRHFEVLDLDLPAIRAAARAGGSSVNDVFVSGILGGLRHYHEAHGASSPRLRVLMPISVRDDGDRGTGNRFVPARFVLAADEDPATRLGSVHRTTGEWKAAPALGLSDVLAAGLDLLPPAMVTSVWGSMLKGNDFCATNVPGPPFEVAIAGSRLERLYAFAPPSGAALNVALVTVAGRACIGVNIDPAAIPDADTVVACLRRGFAEVVAAASSDPDSFDPASSAPDAPGPDGGAT